MSLGFAQKHYNQTQEEELFQDSTLFPFIDSLIEKNFFSYTDYALAKKILKTEIETKKSTNNSLLNLENSLIFLCYLSLCSRAGHLCVIISENAITPHLRQCYQESTISTEKITFKDFEFEELEDKIKKGAFLLPKSISSIIKMHSQSREKKGFFFYFEKNWILETFCLKTATLLLNSSPSLAFEHKQISIQINALVDQKKLLPQQAKALYLAAKQSMTIINGGPGTGKTYTAGQLIRVLWNSMTEKQQNYCEITIAAPTGKAVMALQNSLTKALSDLPQPPEFTTKTLHALLGLRNWQLEMDTLTTTPFLATDILIIDECSMMDVRLMALLLKRIEPGTRIIFLGDKDQLPAVESGSIFSDFITSLEKDSFKKAQDKDNNNTNKQKTVTTNVVTLDVCLRAELKEIITISKEINQGHCQAVLHSLEKTSKEQVIGWWQPETFSLHPSALHDALSKELASFYPFSFLNAEEIFSGFTSIMDLFNSFRILSPFRHGPFGVDAINTFLFEHFFQMAISNCKGSKNSEGLIFIAPIIVVKNNYELEIFNGEMGILVKHIHADKQSTSDYFLFPNHKPDGEESSSYRKFSSSLISSYQFAYCLSVHKSQGSEFDRVLLLLPQGSEVFGREVLYTAVTRAKKKLEIWSHPDTVNATIKHQSRRLSGFYQRYSGELSLT